MLAAIDREIDRNFDALQRKLSQYLPLHEGSFALMRDEAVVAFYKSLVEAERAGTTGYGDGVFSIQQITSEPVDLGFFTYAFDHGQAGSTSRNN